MSAWVSEGCEMKWAPRWVLMLCIGCLCCVGCDQLAALELAALPGLAKLSRQKVNASCETGIVLSRAAVKPAGDDSFFDNVQHDDPRSVVTGFLEAIKRADGPTLQRLLTARAREACQSNGLELAVSQEHPLAACRVLQADYLPGDSAAAHVRCLWSDAALDVSAPAKEVIFVLRSEARGWRIAGMVVEALGGADVFDLESDVELQSLSAI